MRKQNLMTKTVDKVFVSKISKHHLEEMFHYNKLKDDILKWDGVHFPTGNRGIDRIEEKKISFIKCI